MRMSSPHAITASPPAQHGPASARGTASHGPVMIAFGSLMASGGEMAITRGSDATSANSR
jgi:hypothetical protein